MDATNPALIENCIRILPVWTGQKIEITPITNQNYRAQCLRRKTPVKMIKLFKSELNVETCKSFFINYNFFHHFVFNNMST